MFVIEGIDKVREIIKKNKERKLSKTKKISNNKILKINNICPIKLLELQKNLAKIAKEENIEFVYGRGNKKTQLQIYESIESSGQRLMKYKESFEKVGEDRNSYSKTDVEATFMRMKEEAHAKWATKTSVQCTNSSRKLLYHSYISKFG